MRGVRISEIFDGSLLGVYYVCNRSKLRAGAVSTLSIGDSRSAMVRLPARELPVDCFPLVRSTASGHELLCPEAFFDGRLRSAGAPVCPYALCSRGLAVPCGDYTGVWAIELRDGSEFTLSLGHLHLHIAPAELPQPLALSPAINWRDHSATALVAVLVALVLSFAAAMPKPPYPLWGRPDWQARISLWVSPPRAADRAAPLAAPTSNYGWIKRCSLDKLGMRAFRPSPSHAWLRRPVAVAAAHAADVLPSGRPAALAALLNSESVLGAAASALAEATAGGANGEGGAADGGALVGSRPTEGGIGSAFLCGSSPCVLGGPSRSSQAGTYGSRVGTLSAHCGRASGPCGAVEVIAGSAEVSCGGRSRCYDKDLIRRVIRSHHDEVRYCYERALIKRSDLEGRVAMKLLIEGDGHVSQSLAAASTVADPAVADCIAGAARRWQFPALGSGLIEVNYPFELHAGPGGFE